MHRCAVIHEDLTHAMYHVFDRVYPIGENNTVDDDVIGATSSYEATKYGNITQFTRLNHSFVALFLSVAATVLKFV